MEAVGVDAAWLVVHQPDGARHHHRLTLALTTLGRSEQNVIEVLDPKLSRGRLPAVIDSAPREERS